MRVRRSRKFLPNRDTNNVNTPVFHRIITILLILCLLVLPGTLSSEDLTIEDALSAAAGQAGAVKISEGERHKRLHAVREAKSRYFPRLDISASASYLTNPPEGYSVAEGELGEIPALTPFQDPLPIPEEEIIIIEDPENTRYSLTATLKQPLFTWGRIREGVKLAELEHHISYVSTEQVRREVLRDTKTAYFTALLARESLPLLIEAEEVLQVIRDDRRKSYDQEMIALKDVLEAEANQASMQTRIKETETGYRNALTWLSILTGFPEDSLSMVSDFSMDSSSINSDVLLQETLKDHPELKTLEHRIRQADSLMKLYKADAPLKPGLGLDITLDLSGEKIPLTDDDWTDTWNVNFIVTVGTSLSLFDAGETRAKAAQAKEDRVIAMEGYSETERMLKLAIQQTVDEVTLARYRVREKEAEVLFTREQYENARVSFNNELITREDQLGARLEMIWSELDLLAARYEYEKAFAELEYLTGEFRQLHSSGTIN